MNASSKNVNIMYFVVGALVVLIAMLGYYIYTSNATLERGQEGINLEITEQGVRGTINTDGR